VIAHLIESCLKQFDEQPAGGSREGRHERLIAAVSAATAQLRGTYGLAVLFRDEPEVIVAARCGSPLVVGVGHGSTSSPATLRPWRGTPSKSFTLPII
jgi:glucosamine--fructose-6-phosphate aminotransferase (isomerizing)